jgi:hypothetical protein
LRLIVPYVAGGLQRQTLAVALSYDAQVDFVNVGENRTYATILAELWGRQETVLLMEHDVAATVGQLRSLERCAHPWCAFTYAPYDDAEFEDPATTVMLGCCKLSTEFMRATRRAWFDPSLPWWHCDVRISAFGRAAGIAPHQHFPNVQHLNPALQASG